MNWTEGALARHSRRKGWDKDAARQKEYFVKARARKHEAATKKNHHLSSFVPDYIPRAQGSVHSSSPIRHKSHVPRNRLTHQRNEPSKSLSNPSSRSSSLQVETRAAKLSSAQEPPVKQETLEAKRRRLLEKSDWTGVNFQKPIVVDFSWQRDSSQRHKLANNDAKGVSRRHITENPPHWRRHHKLGPEETDDHGHEDQMRVRIGSWDVTSSYFRSPRSHPGLLPTLETWNSQQGRISSPYSASHSSFRTSLQAQSARRYEHPSPNNSPAPESQHPVTSESITNQDSSGRNIHPKRRKISDDPGIVVRSPPPVIHHPQPTRGSRLRLFDIRSPDSQAADSTIAQIGALHDAFNRVTGDDIQWNSWLHPPKGIDEEPDLLTVHKDLEARRSITPGVSQYWDHSEARPSSTHIHETSTEEITSHRECSIIDISSTSSTSDDMESVCNYVEPERLEPLPETSSLITDESEPAARPANIPTSEHEVRRRYLMPANDLVLPSMRQLPQAPKVQDLMDLLIEEEQVSPRRDSVPGQEADSTPVDEDEI
ncbi:Fc.00g101690.m01.CDS01 [Cosmosporella sp. VM-42]